LQFNLHLHLHLLLQLLLLPLQLLLPLPLQLPVLLFVIPKGSAVTFPPAIAAAFARSPQTRQNRASS
jgi:hypothetical protein